MAPALSAICAASAVPGMTAVTRGSARRYLRKNCAQLSANPRAQSGSLLTMHGAKQPRAAERQRRQHAGLDLGSRRQNALFSFAVVERIVDLNEIRLLPQQYGFDRGILFMPGRRDADVATDTSRLPFFELRQRLPRITHVVKLQQVNSFRLQSCLGALEFGGVGRLELGGDEEFVAQIRHLRSRRPVPLRRHRRPTTYRPDARRRQPAPEAPQRLSAGWSRH